MEKGKEYEQEGELPGWMKNDLFAFIYEELADTHNYAMLQFMKLRIVQEVVDASGLDLAAFFGGENAEHEVPLGPGAFTTGSPVSGFVQPNRGSQDS
jgi:hypothetical protein